MGIVHGTTTIGAITILGYKKRASYHSGNNYFRIDWKANSRQQKLGYNNLDSNNLGILLSAQQLETKEVEATQLEQDIEDICFFVCVKDQNLFHRVDTIGNIFTSGAATSENINDGVHEMK